MRVGGAKGVYGSMKDQRQKAREAAKDHMVKTFAEAFGNRTCTYSPERRSRLECGSSEYRMKQDNSRRIAA